jgi:hypothetical protein
MKFVRKPGIAGLFLLAKRSPFNSRLATSLRAPYSYWLWQTDASSALAAKKSSAVVAPPHFANSNCASARA